MDVGTQYCKDNNFQIINIVQEVCSAKDMNKQEKLIELINANENVQIIIHDPSRISRNITDFTKLLNICKNKKITLHFTSDNLITNNNTDIKMVLSSVYDSEIEIENLSKRVKASIEQRKRNKTYLPSIPKYGYVYEKKISNNKNVIIVKKNKQEQQIINLINKMYWGSEINPIYKLLQELTGESHEIIDCVTDDNISRIDHGNMTFVDIANFLNSNLLTRRNRPWNADAISAIINEKNVMKTSANIDL